MIREWKIAGRCFEKQPYGRTEKKGEEFKVG
jgi:hypothetical protein